MVKTQRFCAREALENDARQRGGTGGPHLPGQVGQHGQGTRSGCLDPAHTREVGGCGDPAFGTDFNPLVLPSFCVITGSFPLYLENEPSLDKRIGGGGNLLLSMCVPVCVCIINFLFF